MSEFPRSDASTAAVITTELVDRLPSGVMVYHLDDEGDPGSLRLVHANSAASEAFGYDLTPQIGQTIRRATPQALTTELPSVYAAVAQTGRPHDFGEIEYQDDRTQRSVFRVNAFPLPDRHVGVLLEEVTSRQSNEAARYRALVDASAKIVWETKPNGEIRDMPQWRAYTGQSKEEVRGLGWLDAIHPEDRERSAEAWSCTVDSQGRVPYDIEYRILGADGTYRWFNARGVPILGDDGTIEEWVGVCEEIDERKRAEEELADSEARYRFMSETLQQQIWTANPDGQLDYVNQYVLDYFGRTYEEMIGRGWQGVVHEDDLPLVVERWTHALESGDPYEVEFRLRCHDDGAWRWHIGRASALQDDEGRVVKWFGANTDIDEKKRMEHVLAEANRQLEARVSERTQALAGFSEDLKALHRITTTKHASPEGFFQDYLRAGCVIFEMPIGILSETPLDEASGERIYRLHTVESPLAELEPGLEVPLRDAFCDAVVGHNKTVSYADAAADEELACHAAYAERGLRAFIGTPIWVDGELFGTLNFVSPDPRADDFAPHEHELIEVMAELVGRLLSAQRAERSRAETAAHYRSVVQTIDEGLVLVNAEGSILMSNPAAANMLGLGDEDVLGRVAGVPRWPVVSEDGEPIPDGALPERRVLRTGEPVTAEVQGIAHPDGTTRWVSVNARPANTDAEGQIAAVAVSFVDITEIRDAEQRVLSTNAFLQNTLDALASHIAILDENFTILAVNAAWDRFGVENELAMESNGVGSNYIHACEGSPDHTAAAEVVAGLQSVLRGERERFEVEYPCHGPDEKRWFLFRVTRFEGFDDLRLVVAHENITDLKLAEAGLRANEAQLQKAQELARIGSWQWEIARNHIVWSDELYRIFGVEPGAFLPTFENYISRLHPDDQDRVKEIVGDSVANRTSYELDHRVVRPDGTIRHVHGIGEVVLDANGEPVSLQGTAQDVTETYEADQSLRHYADQLEERNAELEQFAYVASHDLQEPLRMVSSFLQLLQRRYADQLDETADEYIEYAVDGAKRMQILIQDLLAYSRVGTRGKPFDEVEMSRAAETVLGDLALALEDVGASVEVNRLPTVVADESQIRQVLQNLIGNAVKFRGDAPPEVHVSAERTTHARTDGSEGPGWRFAVADNGIGIAPEHAERIFQIFQRLHTRDEYEGTGIGLAMCKKIVERHGGRIWFESAPGNGATFYFTIPDNHAAHTPRLDD